MIRIIYSWHVEPENFSAFIESWKRTTNKIHEEVNGARGSFMLQNDKNTSQIKTIARWDSLKDWERFWHDNKHEQMHLMHELGKRLSVEIYREVDDFTK